MIGRIAWTPAMEQYILDNYPGKGFQQIADELSLPKNRVRLRHYYLVNGGSEHKVHRYRYSDVKYLLQKYATTQIVDLARHIGVSADSLRKKILSIRDTTRRGRDLFPPKNKTESPEGTIRKRKDGRYIKKDGVWVRYTSAPRPKRQKEKVTRERVPKPLSSKTTYGKPIRRERALRIAPPDLSSKIAVKVDAKTTVYVDPGTDIEALKLKYKRSIV